MSAYSVLVSEGNEEWYGMGLGKNSISKWIRNQALHMPIAE